MSRSIITSATRSRGGMFQWQTVSGCRRVHQATATIPDLPSEYMDSGATTSRGRTKHGLVPIRSGRMAQGIQKIKELEQKVEALEHAIKTDSLHFNPSTYTEEELSAIYEDVLSAPKLQTVEQDPRAALDAIQKAQVEDDLRIIESLENRLLNGRQEPGPTYRRILKRADEVLSRAEDARQAVDVPSDPRRQDPIPLGILSLVECESLVRAAIEANDGQAAEETLEIMRKDNMRLPEDSVNKILRFYSETGNSQAADRFLQTFLTETPTETQRHLHIRSHLKGTPPDAVPISALNLLHHYENQNVPAPIQTYTSVITSLFSRPSSVARAHAWDIFTHMRYVAHPNPDALLYTLMIRACASPITTRYSSEPEKALDFWTEMTVDQNIPPTVGAYNAVILACARSGIKTYINEGFRLARQMLDSHRDARGYSPFRPDKKTFCALLEGTKRIGDLPRARWILAEMVKSSGDKSLEVSIDEEVMVHVFHAYAAYRVPSARPSARLLKDNVVPRSLVEPAMEDPKNGDVGIQSPARSESQKEASFIVDDGSGQPSFAHIPPQTRGEVIQEVKILFNHILQDSKGSTPAATLPFIQKEFRNVELTTRLLASYLSVFYKHASLESSQNLFWTLFDDLGLTRSARTYVEALERCANARKGFERDTGLRFAQELWVKWSEIENVGSVDGRTLNPRSIERAHIAMIRVLSINDDVFGAMDLLRSFVAKYPPNAVRTPSPRHYFQSTQTSLTGSRPLVRMSSFTEVPDDNVPPLITFRDVELLHHRLVDEERGKDVRYITWVCKAYEWALRVRRDEAIKAKPRDASSLMVC